jgi:hypothetical protein
MASQPIQANGRLRTVGAAGVGELQRQILPIPDSRPVGLTTYDAKDLASKYPPNVRLRPPSGPPNILIVLIDDAVRLFQRLRWPVPDTDREVAGGGWPEIHALSHHGAVLANAPGLDDRPESPLGEYGLIAEVATSAPGYNSIRPKDKSPHRRNPQAQRLLDGTIRQVPRGACLGNQPDGPVP